MRARSQLRFGLGLIGALAATVVAAAPAAAEDVLTLAYDITIAGVHVGSVDADARFTESGYAIALSGAVGGVSRLVSNASARMASNGNISGRRILPAYFEIEMTENDLTAEAEMHLANRRVTDLHVVPGLVPAWDRVPLTMAHLDDVVDPMSALFIVSRPGGLSGGEACNRTIRVFDSWQRFDIVMRHDTTRNVVGAREAYAGPVHICSARYVPVAGHRPDQASVAYMTGNDRLEAWLLPVPGIEVMVPYQLLIGTELGDLVVRLDKMTVRAGG